MKKTSLLLITLCSIGLSPLAYADHHVATDTPHGKKCEGMSHDGFSINDLDTDKDGKISKEEYLAGEKINSEKTFKHIDANNDGQLDQAEQKEIEVVYKNIHDKNKVKNKSM